MTQSSLAEVDSMKFVESVIAESPDIATMPEVTVKIIDIVENPKSKMEDLHDVIRNDPALSARILKVVNSALYGLPASVANIDRAIVLLGLSAVKNIAIATSMTHLFNGQSGIAGFSLNDIWRHSVGMGVGAKLVYSSRKRPGGDEAFLAGLIADLGMLIERQALGQQMAEVIQHFLEDGGDYCALEQEYMGANHQQFGLAITKQWRFPDAICKTNGYHHDPLSLPVKDRELPMSVYLADVLACRLQVGFCTMPADQPIEQEVINELGMTDGMLASICDQMPEHIRAAEAILNRPEPKIIGRLDHMAC
ncbi:MAG: HDOD domain-containing protein [Planctomycetes bacterium]|nr:HDOD domain-containing protein [Planctomycetota bacterium]